MMTIVAARVQPSGALQSADLLCVDQEWIDEEFFRIIRRSFTARTATCWVPPPVPGRGVRAPSRMRRDEVERPNSFRLRSRSPPACRDR